DYSDELDDTRKQEYLRILVTESDRISRLINQVLDIEKIQSNEAPLNLEMMDLCDLVRQAAKGMEQMFAERHVTIRLHGTEHPFPLQADRDRLMQVVVNLLSNALKFCDQEDGQIDISLEKRDQWAVLRVLDNGPGIVPSLQQMIFEKFTQLHSKAQGKPQGTGLGLFITKSIVEKHGGSIRVESHTPAVSKGAMFEVKLPVKNGI
ncbi:MAG: HAMP domain-containing histidine kinase, partial [Saprospiraceae bacterium]|nr:HAMP domain-containing histidine kinase [Saprospiraceae bacterium]